MNKNAGIGDMAKKVYAAIKAAPKHYSNPISGVAATAHRTKQYIEHPDAPFFAGLLMPTKAKTAYTKVTRHIDEKLGELVSNPFKKKGIFIKKEMVPDPVDSGKYLEHTYSSISAPVGKVSKIAAPILGSLYVADKLENMKKTKEADKLGMTLEQYEQYSDSMEKESSIKEGHMDQKDSILVPRKELEKTAAALKMVKQIKDKSDNLEKTAKLQERAEKVAFTMVEMGAIPAFKSYDQFHEKVASLMKEDLDVVEKALQINTQQLASLGKLSNRSVGNNALEAFVMEE